ncbi:hypothetical protein [uncultured Sphingopyxis sp.]|jgi:hypothetical protein|uniref:hypothetical protein n=1 Tax=uncultured Sphingopyxis sp. TaxID=310581 RepID=UPI002595819A|nr:hypothetical protein [uncultured Sphingopyxis sp.]
MMSNLSAALPASIASKETTSALATIGDAALDAAISSGALDGVPILGAATGIWRAHKEVGQQLFMRKVVRFLRETNQTADQDRIDFVDRLKADGKTEEFGEAILLILDRLDDTVKPGILGRLVAAHIRGDLDYDKMMRLTSIVSRCYAEDLELLRNFSNGVQREKTPIAESLFAAGLLSNGGMDGGNFSDPLSGGIIFNLNEYGDLLKRFGL